MKRKSSICFLHIFLFFTQISFPQQQQLSYKNDKSEINSPPFTRNNEYPFSSSKEINDSRDTVQIFPARGGDVDYGLALSGGGIRSALFSIGVMKALHDIEILQHVDVISSASGGGYASYWLFTQHLTPNNGNFGEAAFRKDNFIREICELQSFKKSNALPNIELLKLIANYRNNGAFNAYKDALVSTFGNNVSPEPTLDAFSNKIENHTDFYPYFIFNSTVRLSDNDPVLAQVDKKERETKKKLYSVFEITPEFMGNPKIGFTNWVEYNSTKPKPTMAESMAISGAPKWKLDSSIHNPKQDMVNGKKLWLSDGGHSENLAALALIRRGIKNVIIVDAEQDANYDFIAYKNLKKLLKQKEIDITLEVKEIDDFKASCFEYKTNENKLKNVCSPPAVMKGKATRLGENPIDIDIYYIKMSQPKSIYFDRFSNNKAAYDAGEKLSIQRCKDRCGTNECDDKDALTCNCDNIKANFTKKDLENLYTYEVKNYSDFINYASKKNSKFWTRAKIKFMNNTIGKIHPFFAYKFPHTTTADQSFYSDQLEAFIGLGYLQAIEFEER